MIRLLLLLQRKAIKDNAKTVPKPYLDSIRRYQPKAKPTSTKEEKIKMEYIKTNRYQSNELRTIRPKSGELALVS